MTKRLKPKPLGAPHRRRAAAIAVSAALAWWVGAQPVRAAEPTATVKLKSALILKVMKFVSWPKGALGDSEESVALCVYGEDRLGLAPFLSSETKGKSFQGRDLRVHALEDAEAARAVSAECRILFVTGEADDAWTRVWPSEKRGELLVLGESSDTLRRGGMISIDLQSGKPKLDADIQNINRSRLKFDSRMLNLARKK